MTHAVFAYLKLPREHQDSAVAQARAYAREVRGEAGNLRFEIGTNGAGGFFFWEATQDEAAFEVHAALHHVAGWRAFYEPFMIERRLEEI